MKFHGVPEVFWLVLQPSPRSELGDICFRCDLQQFARQVRGGLDEEDIVGVFADEGDAVAEAKRLLGIEERGADGVSQGNG